MSRATQLRVLSNQVLAVGEDLRDYQLVELLDAEGRQTTLYSRYLNSDRTKWVRHGLFQSFHENGKVKSEGYYHHGTEQGLWCDRYDNGVLAAEGNYSKGEHVGTWQYWDTAGKPEEPDHFPPAPPEDW